MLIFAEFGKFRYTGPAVAVSLAVALIGAMTLTPALLRLVGPIAFWPFSVGPSSGALRSGNVHESHSGFGNKFWDSLSRWIARRPSTIWVASILLMLPFAIWGTQLIPTYDFLSELDHRTESKIGSALIQRDEHFPKGTLGRLTILFKSPENDPKDFRSPEARKDIADLTRRLALGGAAEGEYYDPAMVARVLSLTSPLGKPLPLNSEKPPEQNGQKAAANAPEDTEPDSKPKKRTSRIGTWIGSVSKAAAQAITNPINESGVADRAKEALEQAWKDSTEYYVSNAAAGAVTRLELVFNVDPFSRESMQLRTAINQLVRQFTATPGTALSGASHTFAGITSTTYDLQSITQSDQKRVNVLVVIAVYLILVLLLKKPGVCIYLMFTVLFSYYATLGLTEGFFRVLHLMQHPGQPWLGLDWKVAFFLFIILVAVGEDYNILLMSRVVEEEKKWGGMEGVRIAVARTGGIITSCGIIMAGTFGSMATGTLAAVKQLGFSLALGVLLDTFIVRPVLVPAFLMMIHRVREKLSSKPTVPPPHGGRSTRHTDTTPVVTGERRGLIALLVAWLGNGWQ
jgi:RND superfamily putative drug exporter